MDPYRYDYLLPGGTALGTGDDASPVRLECAVRGGSPPVPSAPPVVAHPVGIDVEPLDLSDPATAQWLAACVPPEVGAVARFGRRAGTTDYAPFPASSAR